jgi:WD repeat-containing protein 35
MFVYLSKKIAIPNNNKVKSLSWSTEHGFIAVGGDEGLLKVLKLDSGEGEGVKNKGLAAPKNLSMNQTLEGHNGSVAAVCWNETYQKLTSSDQNGLIIVWMLYKGLWYEEMVNSRNKTVVRGMAWTCDGLKICIIYDDGTVIVGSVDGNRLWGKELKNMRLSQVEWSPDGRLILFGVLDSEIHVYDQNGNFISKVSLPAIQGIYVKHAAYGNSTQVVGIKWYNGLNGSFNNEAPTLAIAFENGRIQLMKYECDDAPIIIDVELKLTCICWNSNGTILAVTGRIENESDNKRNFVKFYNQFGEIVQTLKIPGKDIYSCSWEKESLRIALAVDSYIFFANIRPDYKWCYFASTIVYAINNINQNSEEQIAANGYMNTVVFWHIPSNTKHIKSVRNLLQISSCGHYCIIATKFDETGLKKRNSSSLIICNAIGTPVDTVNIELLVNFVAINSTRVIAASKESFCIWRFNTPSAQCIAPKGITAQRMTYSEMGLAIDGNDLENNNQTITIFVSRNDPIVCITASERFLMIGQESGCFQQYLLPNASLTHRFNMNCIPSKILLNKDSSKLSVIGLNGTLFIYDFEANNDRKSESSGKILDFERHDCWDMKWANDNCDMIAITEKTKLIIFDIKTLEPEDPISSSGHICSFDDLLVRTVLLDELIIDGNQGEDSSITKISEQIIDFETKCLRDARLILEKEGLSEAIHHIEEQSHPRLWRLLAHSALNALDLDIAELAMVKCKDYKGIQFVKRVAQLNNDSLKRAEIYAFEGQFDESETVYIDIDRRDLAIQLRKTLGDYQRVVDLLKGDFGSTNDNQMRDALCNLGDYYADNHKWEEAVVYYENCGAFDRLFECYCILENYDGLKKLVTNFNENHPILIEFGRTFESVGMCEEAVNCYLKARKVELAINCCVTMSEWKIAIDLAHEYDVPNIDSLLSKYAEHLLMKEKYFDIVELYRKANKVFDASSMLLKVIEDAKRDAKSDPILLKKLYTLIGLLYEENRKSPTKLNKKSGTLNSLLSDDSFSFAATNFKSLDEPWKGCARIYTL